MTLRHQRDRSPFGAGPSPCAPAARRRRPSGPRRARRRRRCPRSRPRTTSHRSGPERFSNRELSWLEFGARLLDLADDERRAAARAGQVPGHLLRRPRRVLPGAGGRAEGPGRRGAADPVGRRAAPQRGAAGHRRERVASSWTASRTSSSTRSCPALADGGRPRVGLVVARRRRPRRTWSTSSTARSSPCSRRCRSTPGTRSPTSRTCRST